MCVALNWLQTTTCKMHKQLWMSPQTQVCPDLLTRAIETLVPPLPGCETRVHIITRGRVHTAVRAHPEHPHPAEEKHHGARSQNSCHNPHRILGVRQDDTPQSYSGGSEPWAPLCHHRTSALSLTPHEADHPRPHCRPRPCGGPRRCHCPLPRPCLDCGEGQLPSASPLLQHTSTFTCRRTNSVRSAWMSAYCQRRRTRRSSR